MIDADGVLDAIACPTLTDCVAVDGSGQAIEGDPQGTAPWVAQTIADADALTAVSCSAGARCVAVDDAGDAFAGNDPSQPVDAAPSVVTGSASDVTASSATPAGTVDPDGGQITDCELQWGTDATYSGGQVPCDPAPGQGTVPIAVTADLAGLATGVTYHYRFVAENTDGLVDGADETFTAAVASSARFYSPDRDRTLECQAASDGGFACE